MRGVRQHPGSSTMGGDIAEGFHLRDSTPFRWKDHSVPSCGPSVCREWANRVGGNSTPVVQCTSFDVPKTDRGEREFPYSAFRKVCFGDVRDASAT